MKSYKVAVKVYGEPNWAYNAQRFATRGEAEQAGKDLSGRWTSLEKFEVQESPDPVNYRIANGTMEEVASPAPPPAPRVPAAVPPPVAVPSPVSVVSEEGEDMLEEKPVSRRRKAQKAPKKKRKERSFVDGSSMSGIFNNTKDLFSK